MKVDGLRALLAVSMLCSACGDDNRKKPSDQLDGGATEDGGAPSDAERADGSQTDGAEPGAPDASGDGGALGAGDGGSPFPVDDAGQVLCGSVACACADGMDGDQDGLTDLADPECVSAWDDDESSFATGISGDNRDDACQDCFFDGNSGSGNDGCRLPSSCLLDGTAASGQGGCSSCTASAQCQTFCQAYTPNGCDCFGCCGVRLASGVSQNVLIGSGCNIDGDNLSGCTECMPSNSCGNSCGRCELCPGKTLADLPADCGTAGDGGTGDGGVAVDGGSELPVPSCDEGQARCGPGLPLCEGREACSFGCCVLVPLL